LFILYAPNVHAPNFIKHSLLDLKTQMVPNTVVVGDFNTPLSPIDRSFRQKNQQKIVELNDIIDLMKLTNVYRVLHPTTA
jgi:hypothetical protein